MKKSTVVLLLAALALALIVLAILFGRPLWELLTSRERVEDLVRDAGAWGPLVFIGIQMLQVLAAPIPGQVTGFVAGYLFGTGLGTLYAMIGVTIGFTLVFILARKLGRPFVEYFVDKKTLSKFDYLSKNHGVFVFFLMALLPFFPDDLICFIAGLTKIPIKTLIIITFLGRLPGNFLLAYAGSSLANENVGLMILVTGIIAVVSAVAWWKRKDLEQFTKKISTKP